MNKTQNDKPNVFTKPGKLSDLEPGSAERSFRFDADTVRDMHEADLRPFSVNPEIRTDITFDNLQLLSKAAPDGALRGHVHYDVVIEALCWNETDLPIMDSNLSGPASGIIAAAQAREGYERPEFFDGETDFPRSTHCYYNAGFVAGLMREGDYENIRVQACTLAMPNRPSHYVPAFEENDETIYVEIYPMLGTGPNNARDSVRVARTLPDNYQMRHTIGLDELDDADPTINEPVDDHTGSGMIEGFSRGSRLGEKLV